ncbi:MAG: serine--tRNA ligase [Candidatus Spechtbacterales bacterium]
MISIEYIRQNAEAAEEQLRSKGADVDIEHVLKLDEDQRAVLHEVEELRAKRNQLSSEMAKMDADEREKRLKEAEKLKRTLKEQEEHLAEVTAELEAILRKLPNPPAKDVPRGQDEGANVVVRTVGDIPQFSFEPKDYLALAQQHDLIDIERAAKVSGSRFGYIKNEAAVLEFALVRMALDETAKENFMPIVPPVLVNEEAMRGIGYLDKEPEQVYHLVEDNLYLVATAEHAIVPMFKDETLSEQELPKRFIGFSSAFRREAGSYGKDTKGILRVHQFDKVEMVTFCDAATSAQEHERMLAIQERLMQALEIPYQVVHNATGDMAFSAQNQYDIESWIPSEGRYRETHSTSNTTDFQSRRLNIRRRGTDGTELVHILNGTAFAIGRTLIALLENHQRQDGSIAIPKALQPYAGFDVIASA